MAWWFESINLFLLARPFSPLCAPLPSEQFFGRTRQMWVPSVGCGTCQHWAHRCQTCLDCLTRAHHVELLMQQGDCIVSLEKVSWKLRTFLPFRQLRSNMQDLQTTKEHLMMFEVFQIVSSSSTHSTQHTVSVAAVSLFGSLSHWHLGQSSRNSQLLSCELGLWMPEWLGSQQPVSEGTLGIQAWGQMQTLQLQEAGSWLRQQKHFGWMLTAQPGIRCLPVINHVASAISVWEAMSCTSLLWFCRLAGCRLNPATRNNKPHAPSYSVLLFPLWWQKLLPAVELHMMLQIYQWLLQDLSLAPNVNMRTYYSTAHQQLQVQQPYVSIAENGTRGIVDVGAGTQFLLCHLFCHGAFSSDLACACKLQTISQNYLKETHLIHKPKAFITQMKLGNSILHESICSIRRQKQVKCPTRHTKPPKNMCILSAC